MERVGHIEIAERDTPVGSGPMADIAWLTAAVPSGAEIFILIGAGTGTGLKTLLEERPRLSVLVLEPDPRAAEALRTRMSEYVSPSQPEPRVAVLSGPDYSDRADGRRQSLFDAPIVVHPALERMHPREVARARNMAGRLTGESASDNILRRGLSRMPARAASPAFLANAAGAFDGVRVLSIDAFDTLLLRAVSKPADVFTRVAGRALERGLIDADVTPSRFQCLRQNAEARARRSKRSKEATSEVTLQEIYEAWPGSPVVAPRLARLELEVEAELVHAHPGTLALVNDARARGIETALVSDTYFSRDELSRLLVAAGVAPRLFDQILSSSEAGCSKAEGSLFDQLLAYWPGLEPGAVLHVGDHQHADVRQARRAGLRAAQHDTGRTGAVASAFALEGVRYGDVLPEIQSLRAAASTLDASSSADGHWFFALGASVLGPALAAFADWVVAECLRDGIRTIRPLMREGALFADMISAAAAARGVDLDIKPLYVSRSSTWLAGLGSLDRPAIRRLAQRQHLTVREALATVHLENHPDVAALLPFADRTLGEAAALETAAGTSVVDLFVRCLEQEAVQAHVATAIADARTLFQRYLDDACGESGDVALVDLGFHCSIGRAIDGASEAQEDRRFHHLLLFAAESVAKLWAEGTDVRVFGAGPIDDADLAGPIARHPALLEVLLIGGGTTLGYQETALGVSPLLAESGADAAQQEFTAECRRGIRRFQDCWLDWTASRPALARHVGANRRGLVTPLHRLLTMPTHDEASRLGAFVHEDNEGGTAVRRLADPSALPSDVSPEQFHRTASSGVSAFGHAWPWPAGICERRWPGFAEARWRDAVGNNDGTPPLVPAVAARMRQMSVSECVIWGAGESGSALLKAIRREGITVLFVTDSNPAHWGTELDGVPVVAPAEAYRRGNHTFAIGSCAFAGEIERALRQHYEAASESVRIFSPLAEAAA